MQQKYYKQKQLATAVSVKKYNETVENILSACPILAKEQFIKRHDRVCAQLHFNICKETGVKLDNKHWYDYVLNPVETSHTYICTYIKVRLPYYGTKKCELTEIFLTINWTK
jgi:hypothetical protein